MLLLLLVSPVGMIIQSAINVSPSGLLVRGEDPGVPTRRRVDVEMEPHVLLDLVSAPGALHEDAVLPLEVPVSTHNLFEQMVNGYKSIIISLYPLQLSV